MGIKPTLEADSAINFPEKMEQNYMWHLLAKKLNTLIKVDKNSI